MAPRTTKKSVTPEPVAVVEAPPPPPVEPVAPPPPPAVTEESTTSSDQEVSDTTIDSFVILSEKLSMVVSELKNLQTVVKSLQKEHNKLKKLTTKKSKSRKADGTTSHVQSGFAKPTKLSDALCAFLSVPKGSELARTEVTRKINEYIKANKLQSENDKRFIVPDDKLKSILELKEGVPLSFFNLQGCLKNHFLKATA